MSAPRQEQTILTPSQVGQYIKGFMDRDRVLSGLLVRGELSNYKMYPSGHHYFTLKDGEGALRCVMFRGDAGRGCAANVGVAQLHLHASQQLVEVEGLGQVIVGAQLQQRHLVGGGRARRHHDDGHVAAGAHEAHHVLARHARQHEIGDHEVERLGAGKQQPPLAAREGLRASEPVAAQMHRHHLVDVGVVLDDHYGCRFAHRGYCTARQTREPAFREPQPHAPSFRSKPKRQNMQ